jgi:hypothetical protein
MGVQLIKTGAKIVLGEPLKVHADKILCDRCDQSYAFHYSPGEEHRLKDWLLKAKAAVNISHDNNHPDTVAVT